MLLHKHNSETYANMVSLFASNQRVLNSQGKLKKPQTAKLNSIGFPWNVYEENWLSAYNEFAKLTERLGHFPSKS